jgi:hypothetical protein
MLVRRDHKSKQTDSSKPGYLMSTRCPMDAEVRRRASHDASVVLDAADDRGQPLFAVQLPAGLSRRQRMLVRRWCDGPTVSAGAVSPIVISAAVKAAGYRA